MKRINLLFFAIVLASTFASAAPLPSTGWFSDFVKINVNGAGTTAPTGWYWIGTNPSYATQLQDAALGTVSSLVIEGCDMKYSSTTQDRTGGAFYYKIMSSDGSTEVVAPVETIWDQTGPTGNDYQGLKATSINVLSGLNPGSYRLHVYAKSWGSGQGDSWLSNGGANYWATFSTPAVMITGANGIADGTYYSTLKDAFDAINLQPDQTGKNIEIKIGASTTETASAVLNQPTTASWTSLTIYPTATATISGAFVGTIIDLNGADNVTINGRLNKTGTAKSLTISHTSNADNGNRTIRLTNDAKTNTIQYATITGKCPSTGAGVIFLSTTTGTDGNDGNIIEYCDINAMGAAAVGIGSAGTAAPKDNSGNIIRNNNIFDFYLGNASTNATYGINISAGNTDWEITGNSTYQTAPRAYIATGTTYTFHYGIYVSASAGNNFIIKDNYIGGSAPLAGGTPWTMTAGFNRPVGLYTSVGTTTASSVQNNTITNFDITTDYVTNANSAFIGYFHAAGSVNAGTITGNTIGSITSNGAIVVKFNSAVVGSLVVGLNITTGATATQVFSNNKIGGIIADYLGTVNRGHLYAVSTGGAGALTFTNNTIGSTTVANSIEHKGSTYTGGQVNLRGITMGNIGITLTGNTIANLKASSTASMAVCGVFSNGTGSNNYSNNIIRDIKSDGTRVIANQGIDAGLAGIVSNSNSTTNTISGNSIYNLENTNTTLATDVYGINIHNTHASSAGTVSSNKIYNLITASTNTAANVVGISITRGLTNTNNNMISLGNGITNAVAIAGIRKLGTVATQNNNFYHNTVLLSGSEVGVAGTSSTGAFVRVYTATDEVKNNIFINTRSNASGNTQKHYAVNLNATTTLTEDNNILYVSGTGGLTGAVATNDYAAISDWKTGTSLDANSKSKAVEYVSTSDLSLTGTSINDAELGAPLLATVSTDITGVTTRNATTYMGAHEASNLTVAAPSKTFTVTVPNGTAHVYVAGTFTGKKWNITTPHELTATANPNEFTGTFACANDVTYKYLCETGDFDYQAAVSAGGVAESNRTYNAVDPAVVAWLNMKSVTLNVSFASNVPSKLFVKGSWDTFATPIELVKTGSTFSTTLSGILANKIPSNTEYKYYTDQEVAVNWESNTDNSIKDNRWSITPVMNDVIARFTTAIISDVNNISVEPRILRTADGIEVIVAEQSSIELYNINGMLIEKTIANGSYTRNLDLGAYIIRINGKATKFIK